MTEEKWWEKEGNVWQLFLSLTYVSIQSSDSTLVTVNFNLYMTEKKEQKEQKRKKKKKGDD